MSETSQRQPNLTQRAKDEAALRQERLAEALRANLKKRKAQARARESLPEDHKKD